MGLCVHRVVQQCRNGSDPDTLSFGHNLVRPCLLQGKTTFLKALKDGPNSKFLLKKTTKYLLSVPFTEKAYWCPCHRSRTHVLLWIHSLTQHLWFANKYKKTRDRRKESDIRLLTSPTASYSSPQTTCIS
jgi:hypothetical protein